MFVFVSRAYNTFPAMTYAAGGPDEACVPPLHVLLELQPWHRNVFENTALVQLDHRVLALCSFTAVCALLALSRRKHVSAVLGDACKSSILVTSGVAGSQVALGVATLVNCVPIPLAVMHQAGSIALLTCCLTTSHLVIRRSLPIIVSKVKII